MTRYPPVPPEEYTFEQRRVVEVVSHRRKPSASSGGGVEGPFVPLVYVPGILDRMQNLGEFCRFHSSVPAKLRELAIMVTARYLTAQIEFYVHAIEAREFGLDEEIIQAVAANRVPETMAEDEAATYAFCSALHNTGTVPDDVFDRMEALIGKAGIIDLIATCGYYGALGLVLNTTQTPVPEFLGDVTMPFPAPAD
jgi:4-carboxymuconolactone decarboxylase